LRIFVSPLDWGLGHAARCVPIIRHLIEKDIEVIIGTEGNHLTFLKEHFPDIEYIEFPGYRVSYSTTLPVRIKVLMQLPKMVAAINKEHKLLSVLIEDKKIDAVISDNRYGLWNEKIPSIIITHQLNIQTPAAKSFFNKKIHNYIKHFNECWIPDYEGTENLSGALSHPIPKGINVKYLGVLSRFESPTLSNPKDIKYDLLVLLSGPEAQRNKLEEIILKQLKELPSARTLIVQGLPGNKPKECSLKNVRIVSHLANAEFQEAINCSDIILSRPGYSTIMDLTAIGWKSPIFIPTPGQTEQEYLGKLLQKKGMAITYNQQGFSLKEALEKVKQLKPAQPNFGKGNYKKVIDEWLKKIS
jgi:uncharacterized protein (TIGR00661 family)